jgi:hypothetical protein
MNKKYIWLIPIGLLALGLAFGCSEQKGKVEQGRVIAFDKAKGTVTIIKDIKHELGKPAYDQLPPVTFAIPSDPNEMGKEPKAGKLMKVDPNLKMIVVFDDEGQNFKNIEYIPIDHKEGVGLRDPLVKGKKFPIVDREKKVIMVYDKQKRMLTTFSLPEEYFAKPDQTFGFGDEVRVYARQPGQAARLMNISETDIFKK